MMPRRLGFAKATERYGYKIRAATDNRDGFVLGGQATPANRSDTEEFVTVLDEVDAKAGESIFADKGYSSQLKCYVLQARGLADSIMYKVARNPSRLKSLITLNRRQLRTVEDPRLALLAFKKTYNRQWRIGRHGYRSRKGKKPRSPRRRELQHETVQETLDRYRSGCCARFDPSTDSCNSLMMNTEFCVSASERGCDLIFHRG